MLLAANGSGHCDRKAYYQSFPAHRVSPEDHARARPRGIGMAFCFIGCPGYTVQETYAGFVLNADGASKMGKRPADGKIEVAQ
jgi:hypothetical protein